VPYYDYASKQIVTVNFWYWTLFDLPRHSELPKSRVKVFISNIITGIYLLMILSMKTFMQIENRLNKNENRKREKKQKFRKWKRKNLLMSISVLIWINVNTDAAVCHYSELDAVKEHDGTVTQQMLKMQDDVRDKLILSVIVFVSFDHFRSKTYNFGQKSSMLIDANIN